MDGWTNGRMEVWRYGGVDVWTNCHTSIRPFVHSSIRPSVRLTETNPSTSPRLATRPTRAAGRREPRTARVEASCRRRRDGAVREVTVVHGADERVTHEAGAQQRGHDVHRHGVGVGFRDAMSNLIFTNVVDEHRP